MRLARRLDCNDGQVPIGCADGRKFASPFDGDDDVGPNGFNLVVFDDAASLMDQASPIDDDESTARLACRTRGPYNQRQETRFGGAIVV